VTPAFASLAAAPLSRAYETVTAPVHDPGGFVGYVQEQKLESVPVSALPGARGKLLSRDDRSGRMAWLVAFPAGYRAAFEAGRFVQSVEFVVLEGGLEFGTESLRARDFAFVPPRGSIPPLSSGQGGRVLVYFDPPAPDAAAAEQQRAHGSYVTRHDESRWLPASVARGAGLEIDLKVQHLKKDPYTTARTWYVKLSGGMSVPWERHSVVEEGYLIEGDFRMAECLPGRTVFGEYTTGGYFWRPPGIPHSGPDSGTRTGALWLQRAPATLDVEFLQGC
jgi:hypothetical protein